MGDLVLQVTNMSIVPFLAANIAMQNTTMMLHRQHQHREEEERRKKQQEYEEEQKKKKEEEEYIPKHAKKEPEIVSI